MHFSPKNKIVDFVYFIKVSQKWSPGRITISWSPLSEFLLGQVDGHVWIVANDFKAHSMYLLIYGWLFSPEESKLLCGVLLTDRKKCF